MSVIRGGKSAAGTRPRRLTAKELTFVAWRAGFGDHDKSSRSSQADNPAAIINAVAIALAESRGKVAAKGGPNSDGSFDLGLWQINTAAHVDKGFRFDRQRLLTDPDYNGQAARKIYEERLQRDGIGWTAWSAYRSGAYLAFRPRAARAARAAKILTQEGDYSSNVATALDERARDLVPDVPDVLSNLAEKLWPVLLQSAMAGTGLALAGYGLVKLVGAGGGTRQAVTRVAPAAAAVAKGAS